MFALTPSEERKTQPKSESTGARSNVKGATLAGNTQHIPPKVFDSTFDEPATSVLLQQFHGREESQRIVDHGEKSMGAPLATSEALSKKW